MASLRDPFHHNNLFYSFEVNFSLRGSPIIIRKKLTIASEKERNSCLTEPSTIKSSKKVFNTGRDTPAFALSSKTKKLSPGIALNRQ